MQGIAQQTQRWEEWRKGKIGSSSAAAIMGASKWCTPLLLWERMLGIAPEQEQNYGMLRGIEMEPRARALYELEHDAEMPPELAEHSVYKFLIASLDGINRKLRTILEIKCPGREDHETALKGEIPKHYIWQLVHQLMVTDMDKVHYFSFKDGVGKLIEFHRDAKLEKELLDAELNFWDMLQKKTPPELTDKDFHVIKDKSTVFLFDAYKEKKSQLDQLTNEVDALKKSIINIANGDRVLCSGVTVIPVTRKGTIEYTKVPELEGINLEPYRKPSSTHMEVRIKK